MKKIQILFWARESKKRFSGFSWILYEKKIRFKVAFFVGTALFEIFISRPHDNRPAPIYYLLN